MTNHRKRSLALWAFVARCIVGLALAATVNAQSAPGPLASAILSEDVDAVRAALDAGESANAPDAQLRRSPLHVAVAPGSPRQAAIVELLVSRGADINAEDASTGLTPLMIASVVVETAGPFAVLELQKSKLLAERLLALGADPGRLTKNGETPLLVAVSAGNLDVLRLLIARGAKPDQAGARGETPLARATRQKRTDIAEALLAAGAKPLPPRVAARGVGVEPDPEPTAADAAATGSSGISGWLIGGLAVAAGVVAAAVAANAAKNRRNAAQANTNTQQAAAPQPVVPQPQPPVTQGPVMVFWLNGGITPANGQPWNPVRCVPAPGVDPNCVMVREGDTANFMVEIGEKESPAQRLPLTVQLSSSEPGVFAVPATLVVPPRPVGQAPDPLCMERNPNWPCIKTRIPVPVRAGAFAGIRGNGLVVITAAIPTDTPKASQLMADIGNKPPVLTCVAPQVLQNGACVAPLPSPPAAPPVVPVPPTVQPPVVAVPPPQPPVLCAAGYVMTNGTCQPVPPPQTPPTPCPPGTALIGGACQPVATTMPVRPTMQVFDGEYNATRVFSDGFVHVERIVVSGMNVTARHTFTKGTTSGSFDWTGTITPTGADRGTISGSGTINNGGTRAFTLLPGSSIGLNAAGIMSINWLGNDPRFGGIGGSADRVPAVAPPLMCAPPQVAQNGVCVAMQPTCVVPQVPQNGVCVTPTVLCSPTQVMQNGVCVAMQPTCVLPQVMQNGVCVTPQSTTRIESTPKSYTFVPGLIGPQYFMWQMNSKILAIGAPKTPLVGGVVTVSGVGTTILMVTVNASGYAPGSLPGVPTSYRQALDIDVTLEVPPAGSPPPYVNSTETISLQNKTITFGTGVPQVFTQKVRSKIVQIFDVKRSPEFGGTVRYEGIGTDTLTVTVITGGYPGTALANFSAQVMY